MADVVSGLYFFSEFPRLVSESALRPTVADGVERSVFSLRFKRLAPSPVGFNKHHVLEEPPPEGCGSALRSKIGSRRRPLPVRDFPWPNWVEARAVSRRAGFSRHARASAGCAYSAEVGHQFR